MTASLPLVVVPGILEDEASWRDALAPLQREVMVIANRGDSIPAMAASLLSRHRTHTVGAMPIPVLASLILALGAPSATPADTAQCISAHWTVAADGAARLDRAAAGTAKLAAPCAKR